MKIIKVNSILKEYDFKVGDEVITSIGEKGIICDICKCEACQRRGFYEPKVKFNGTGGIYITNYDRDCGFKSFYKIGDYIFGNIDAEGAEANMKLKEKDLQLSTIDYSEALKSYALIQKLSEAREIN